MRCIDHPTMLKDGFGWGAMCSVSAAQMTKADFTGAPALTSETEQWKGLTSDWFEPKWDPNAPPTEEELTKKFHDYATPVLGDTRTQEIYDAIMLLENTDTQHLFDLLSIPPEELKIHVS